MIRHSAKKDIGNIITLWNEAFGDSEKEVRFFLYNCFIPENTLVYEVNGEIASMLFLLEGNMCINNADYPSYYLYAACTLKKYRGRGLMAELLAFAQKTASERSKCYICLRPGEKSLFDFYEKHGYKTVFYVRKAKYLIFNSDILSEKFPTNKCNREKARNDAFSIQPYFKWDKSFIDFAFSHNEFFGGHAGEFRKGYSLYTANENEIVVKETTFTSYFDVIKSIDKELLAKSEKLTVNYPPQACTDGCITPYAMICAVDDNSKKILSKIECAYLGLTLE